MSQVPGYDLLSAVGKGGAAQVWRAKRLADAVEVAVKLGHAATEHSRKRFEAEAEAMRTVGSPHALELLDAGVTSEGRPFLIVELLRGGTLADALAERSRPYAIDDIAEIGSAVLVALQAVHDRGLVHRDVKPANIVIAGDPPVASLMDFGLALGTSAADVTRTGVGVGTPKYVAPEQLRAQADVDHRADLYSFGILLYQLATNTVPFDGAADAVEYGHTTLRPPAPSKRAPVPMRLESLILECLAKDPRDRPATADRIRELLVAACAFAHPSEATEAPTSRTPARDKTTTTESIAVLSCEAEVRSLAVVDSVMRRGGFLIAHSGRRFLFGFSADAVESPALAAAFAAKELSAELATSIAVHLDAVDVSRGSAGVPLVAGPAISDPLAWLPQQPWVGVVFTEAAAQSLGDAAADPELEGFARLDDGAAVDGERTLIGRDSALASAERSWTECFAAAVPHTWTLVSEPGMGRTAIAKTIAQKLESSGVETQFVSARQDAALDALLGPLRDRADSGPVALIVDDLHVASNRVLDRLEYAVLEQRGVSLWLAATAGPELSTIRPAWGNRAAEAKTYPLPPMKEIAAMELAARFLEPAEYPPAEVLRTLVRWAGSAPAPLEELARTLKREGFVRPRGRGKSYYLAMPELSVLESSPAIEWLATRALADLPESLAELLEICSALEPPFSVAEVDWIQRGVDAGAPERDVADARAGIAELCRRGSIRASGSDELFELTSSLVRQGVERLIDPERRQKIHHRAARYFRTEIGTAGDETRRWQVLARAARHAAQAGEGGEAAAAYVELGQRQLAANSNLDAEVSFSRALELAAEAGRSVSLEALLSRGRVRYRIDRVPEALLDLAELRELAAAAGNDALVAEALLEKAAALDWAEQFDASQAAISDAAPIVESVGDARLAAQLAAARGRSHWRMSRQKQAAEQLALAAADAERVGCDEARTVAATLLPLALLRCGRLDECEAEFSRSLELFEARADRFHFAAVLVNRMFLWSARQDPERGRADLRRAIAIARELGNPQLERGAVYNLAEDLFWSGDDVESLALAERARVLRRKFWPEVLAVDELLLARIQAALGEIDRAREALEETAWSGGREPAGFTLLATAVHTAVESPQDASWDELISRVAAELPADEALEVRHLAAVSLLRAGDRDRAAAAVRGGAAGLQEAPIWRHRFDRLRNKL